jgi:hypothetical protein
MGPNKKQNKTQILCKRFLLCYKPLLLLAALLAGLHIWVSVKLFFIMFLSDLVLNLLYVACYQRDYSLFCYAFFLYFSFLSSEIAALLALIALIFYTLPQAERFCTARRQLKTYKESKALFNKLYKPIVLLACLGICAYAFALIAVLLKHGKIIHISINALSAKYYIAISAGASYLILCCLLWYLSKQDLTFLRDFFEAVASKASELVLLGNIKDLVQEKLNEMDFPKFVSLIEKAKKFLGAKLIESKISQIDKKDDQCPLKLEDPIVPGYFTLNGNKQVFCAYSILNHLQVNPHKESSYKNPLVQGGPPEGSFYFGYQGTSETLKTWCQSLNEQALSYQFNSEKRPISAEALAKVYTEVSQAYCYYERLREQQVAVVAWLRSQGFTPEVGQR